MQKRKFSREIKLEAVRLVNDRGVAVAQAARDLDLHENVLRKWVMEFAADRQRAFPVHEQLNPEQQEIDRLRKEVAKLKAERDILKEAAPHVDAAESPEPAVLPRHHLSEGAMDIQSYDAHARSSFLARSRTGAGGQHDIY